MALLAFLELKSRGALPNTRRLTEAPCTTRVRPTHSLSFGHMRATHVRLLRPAAPAVTTRGVVIVRIRVLSWNWQVLELAVVALVALLAFGVTSPSPPKKKAHLPAPPLCPRRLCAAVAFV